MKSAPRPMAANERALKSKARIENFEELFDEKIQNIYWTDTTLLKAMPKPGVKIKKMKSR